MGAGEEGKKREERERDGKGGKETGREEKALRG